MERNPGDEQTISNGKVISFKKYTLELEDGEVVDTNVGRNPLASTQGDNRIIHGIESAVKEMEVGQGKQAVIPPTQGYSDPDPGAFHEVRKRSFLKEYRWALSSMGKTPAAADPTDCVSHAGRYRSFGFQPSSCGQDLYFDLKVVTSVSCCLSFLSIRRCPVRSCWIDKTLAVQYH